LNNGSGGDKDQIKKSAEVQGMSNRFKWNWRGGRRLALAAAVAAISARADVRAAILTWDPDQATAGAQGGDGTWSADALNLNWFDGVSNVPWNSSGNIALFNGTPGNVNVSSAAGSITVDGLIFDQPGYTLSGTGSINLHGGITANANGTISATLLGTPQFGGVTKWGAGTLRLTQLAPVGPSLTVNEGAVRIDSSIAVTGSTSLTVSQGAGLLLNASTTLGPTVTNAGNFTIAPTASVSAMSFFNQNAGALTINGSLTLPFGTFVYTAGTVSGNVKFSTGGSAIFRTSSANIGTGNFNFQGTSASLAGNIPLNTTLNLQPFIQGGGTGTLAASWSNADPTGGGTLAAGNSGTVNFGSPDTNNGVSLSWSGTFTNSGTFSIAPALSVDAPQRSLNGTFENRFGQYNVNSHASMSSLINTGGVVNVAAGKTLTASTSTSISSGTLNLAGILSTPTFSFSGGLVTGTVAMTGGFPTLSFLTSGTGATTPATGGTFVFTTMGGNITGSAIPSSTTIRLEPTGTIPFTQSISSFPATNNGTLILSSALGSNGVSLSTTGSSFTNNGTFTSNPGTAGDGTRTIGSAFTNSATGIVNINASTNIFGFGMTNSGKVIIAPGKTLSMTGAFIQTAGTLDAAGVLSTGSFTYTGGLATGSVVLPATNSALGGSIPAGLSVTALSNLGAAGGFNALSILGTLNFSSSTFGLANVTGPPMINSGSINFLLGAGGSHTVSSSISNTTTGTLTASGFDTVNTLNNNGRVSVSTSRSLTANLFRQNAGTLTVDGTLNATNFTYTAGAIDGANRVNVTSFLSFVSATPPSTTRYRMTGSSGTVSAPGLTLGAGIDILYSPTTTNGGSFSYSVTANANNGSMTLSSPAAEQSIFLNLNSGFVNNGTFTTTPSPTSDSGRTFSGFLTNSSTGIMNFNARTAFTSPLTNSGAVNIGAARTTVFPGGAAGLILKTGGSLNVAQGATADVTDIQLDGGDIVLASETFTPGKLLLRGNLQYTGGTGPARIMSTPVAPGDLPGQIDLLSHTSTWDVNESAAPIDLEVSSGIIGTATGGFIKTGPGTLLLSGKNTQGGITGVDSGNLIVASSASLGAPAAHIQLRGGTLLTTAAISGTHPVDVPSGTGTWDTGGFASSLGNIDTLPGATFLKQGAGVLTATHVKGGLNLAAGRINIRPNGSTSGVSYLDSLTLAPSTTLDLNDNDLVMNNAVFSDVKAMVMAGYSPTPDTTKTGLISTSAQNTGGTTILALFDNALAGFTEYPPGSGNSIATGAIVGKYTYLGDTNLDGQVTPQDYTAVDSNLGTSIDPGISWFYGDTNFDGNITAQDYTTIDGALGLGVGNPLSAQSVPEPAALISTIGFTGALAISRRRRKQKGVIPL
jgi:fibronectin-binding autotransporter adhesin